MSDPTEPEKRPGTPVRRALISVSDKDHLAEFAAALAKRGVELISTGGTYRALKSENIEVTEVTDHTGFPEIMAGRVKTLHPKIHGGILARSGADDHTLGELDIPAIDLVVVNLYPFEKVTSEPDCTLENAIENIDIGGPTLLRASAKNYSRVTVVTDSADYAEILNALEENDGCIPEATRRQLAVKAFEHTARYEDTIAMYLGRLSQENGQHEPNAFPATLNIQYGRHQAMRYGENPHQRGVFYIEDNPPSASLAAAVQRHGKALSFNNVADTDAALEMVKAFTGEPTCVIVKHMNPCGIASADTLREAYERAFACDPVSAFGGIIAFNRAVDADTAATVMDNQFVEVLVAPAVDERALEALQKKKNIRVLEVGDLPETQGTGLAIRQVGGGLLVQDHDTALLDRDALQVVSKRQPDEAEWRDLLFAWKAAQYVKSNAIVYARDNRTIGVGAGQMSRVDSARIAVWKARDAGLEIAGSVMASDAFFPFRDSIDTAAENGIRAVIQPGGSRRDDEIIQAVDEAGMTMVVTGRRHFRH